MRRSLVLAVTLALVVSGAVQAAGRPPIVAGDYTYQYGSGTSHVALSAHGGDRTGGWMDFDGTYVQFGGPVTCVHVVGDDAWVAGRVAYGDALGLDAWWVRVRDAGAPGAAGDMAITFIDDPDLAQASCDAGLTDYDDALSPVTDGNLVVHD